MTVYTTLNKIRAFEPSKSFWKKLLDSLGKTQADDEPLALVSILESNKLYDALWCTRTIFDEHRVKIMQFTILYGEYALPIFEKAVPNDQRPRLAIQAAKDYLEGKITENDLDAAADAAFNASNHPDCSIIWVAVYAAYAAYATAHAAYWWDAELAWTFESVTHRAFYVADEKQFQEDLFRKIFG